MEYFEKARELAKLLLDTEEGKRANLAKEAFLANPESVQKMDEFNKNQEIIKTKAHNGEYSEAEFKLVADETRVKFEELKNNAIISELFDSNTAFNDLISQTMNIFSATLAGNDDAGGCSSGGCSGNCGGCH